MREVDLNMLLDAELTPGDISRLEKFPNTRPRIIQAMKTAIAFSRRVVSGRRQVDEYRIEARTGPNANWQHQARFHFGQDSRFGEPFTPEIALREAQEFAKVRYKDYPHVRVIIEL